MADPATPFSDIRSRFSGPLWLLAALVICMPALLIDLGRGQRVTWHEHMSLASSHETWLRMHAGEDRAWLVPTVGGQPRVEKPPVVVWLNLLAWTGLDPDNATTETLVLRSRLVGVALGLLTLIGIFWIGCTLEDARLGFLAAAVAGTLFFFQRHVRMSTYDTAMLAWGTLAVASALWAMAPALGERGARKSRTRTATVAVGWALCAIFLALAWLSKGPLSIVIVAAGLLSAVALMPERRGMRVLGCIVTIALAGALALPWYWVLAHHVPALNERLAIEYSGPPWDLRPPWYYLRKIELTIPWPLWLIAALLHPWMRANGRARRLRLIVWVWFVLLLVFFSAAPPKVPRYVLPLVPAFALMVAHVWRDQAAAAERGERYRRAGVLVHTHWFLLSVASLGLGVLLMGHATLAARGWIDPLGIRVFSVPTGLGVTGLLLGISLLGWRLHHKWRPMRAAMLTFVWCAILGITYWHIQSNPHPGDPDAGREVLPDLTVPPP